jgi:cell wall-associated NlpC family hydrolase
MRPHRRMPRHPAAAKGAARATLLALLLILGGCGGLPQRPAPVTDLGAQGRATPGTRPAVVRDALRLTGEPYRTGGDSPATGFDCSGLVWYVYALQGVRLPRMAAEMAAVLPPVPIADREPGDLLFFDTGGRYSHVAIYIGNDRFVHAPSERTGHVVVSSLARPYWSRRLSGVRRPVLETASRVPDASS